MLIFDENSKSISSTPGGYSNEGLPIRDTFVRLSGGQRGILYEPIVRSEKSRIGVIAIHSDIDYSTFTMCGELAKRGYTVFGGQVINPSAILDLKLLSVKNAIEFLRSYPGVEKVVLMGHSGGGTLMSAYQAVAENGGDIFRGDEMLAKFSLKEKLPPADGIMLIDSNWGNGAMTLFSIDPAVVEEGNGVKLDPELDVYNPANGYDPEGAHYSDAFVSKFLAAQRERNNRIIKLALERLHALEHGHGFYADDEPFIVTGGAQMAPANKLFPQDLRFCSHTKGSYLLLRSDGSSCTENIRSVRDPMGSATLTPYYRGGAVTTSVRHFLTERALMAGPAYAITPEGAEDLLWERGYDCPPATVRHIHSPLLVMGMTGSYEFLAAEAIYQNAVSSDRTIAFAEGATHVFEPVHEKYGDTQKVVFDYMDQWLSILGRFLG